MRNPAKTSSHNIRHVRPGAVSKVRETQLTLAYNGDHASNPSKLTPSEIAVRTQFWSNVKILDTDQCWIWQGSLMNPKPGQDYGQFLYNGRIIGAHRLSFQFKYGPIPQGAKVLHTCDTPRCVNPGHLRSGSQADNMADRHAKGRTWSILTAEQVLEARSRYVKWCRENGAAAMARDYGVGVTTMHDALKGERCWKHLDAPTPQPS